MRHRYFRSPKYRQLNPILALVAVSLCVLVGIFSIYRALHPFESLNPLDHEITVGEKVIDDWTYNGKNAQGYLVFVNKGEQMHLMPPNARELALDGKYVLIQDATDNSLTFEEPGESFSVSLLRILMVLGICGFVLFLLIQKRSRRGRWNAQRTAYSLQMQRRLWLRKIKLFFKYR